MAKRAPRTVFDLDEVYCSLTRDESGQTALVLTGFMIEDEVKVLPTPGTAGARELYALLVRGSVTENITYAGSSAMGGHNLRSVERHERGWQVRIEDYSDDSGSDRRMIIDVDQQVIDFSPETPREIAETIATHARTLCPELRAYRFSTELSVRTVLARTLIEGQTLVFGQDVERILSVIQDIDSERMTIVVSVITDRSRHVFTHEQSVSIWAEGTSSKEQA